MAFWVEIAKGLLPEEAAAVVGVSQPVGARWFHNAGGMPPFDLNKQLTDRYLVFAEREEIALLKAQGNGVTHMIEPVVQLVLASLSPFEFHVQRDERKTKNALHLDFLSRYKAQIATCCIALLTGEAGGI